MNFIIVQFEVEGVHRWKDCPFKDVSFLKNYHRHMFHFKVKLEVFHEDREVEIIRLKRDLLEYVQEILELPTDMSCEMMASLVLTYITESRQNRYCEVSVLEDGENGGGIST